MLFRNVLIVSVLASFVNGDRLADGGAVAGTAREAQEIVLTAEPSGESEAATPECHDFLFSIVTDEFPEDTKYTLINSNEDTIWEESPWGIEDQGKKFDHSACLPVDECYTFIVYDNEEFQDGLIEAPKGGEPGMFTITYDGNIIGEYDGKTDGCFSAKGYNFGTTCPDDILKQDTVGDCTFNKGGDSDVGEDNVMPSPSVSPSESPSGTPSAPPSSGPSTSPSFQPSSSISPSSPPSVTPSATPSSPSTVPSVSPSTSPVGKPSASPSGSPIAMPSVTPSDTPSMIPTSGPSAVPSVLPSASPSGSPIAMPSFTPSDAPSAIPTSGPSAVPSVLPSASPSSSPIAMPSVTPSDAPSAIPTYLPSAAPSVSPSTAPASKPSSSPTSSPVAVPSVAPSDSISMGPTVLASAAPSVSPSAAPTETLSVREDQQLAAPTLTSNQTDCIPFRFLIALDGFPTDVMYTLMSAQGDLIWDERPWLQRDAGKVFESEACLDPLDCFTFTIVDAYDDGLTKPSSGGNAGTFVLEFDSEIIASYHGEDDGCYTRKSYTFGGQCATSQFSVPEDGSCGAISRDEIVGSTPTEEGPKCANSELDFYFSVTTDQNPDHTFFTIMGLNNGDTVWEEGPWQIEDENYWSDVPDLEPQNLTKHLCLDPAECYTFWIDDRSDDGMTSGEQGHFVVQIDSEIVATYDGETDGCFKSKSYTFGSCGFTEETMPEGGACGNEVGTEDTDIVSDAAAAPIYECSDSELDFHFVIATDEYPHHSYFTLATVFTSNVVWEEGPWMPDPHDERYWSDVAEYDVQTMVKHLCLDPDECYVFYVDDRYDDGMTGSHKGHFELQLDGNVVDTYDGGSDGCYRSKSYTFGGPCEFSMETTPGDC